MKNTIEAVVLETDGTVYKIDLPKEDSLSILQDTVGGLIDVVRGENFVGYVNDEGLLIGLTQNIIASALFGRLLVGNVVIVGALDENGYYDGENHDTPAEVYTTAVQLASRQRVIDAILLVNS